MTVRLGATVGRRSGRRVLGVRHDHHVPRLPGGVRGGRATTRTPQPATTQPSAGCRRCASGDALTVPTAQPDGHATKPPARYTEAVAGQGAGGARHRPPVDVRLDHRHDPRPRLRVQEGHRARPVVAGVRRGRSCWRSTSAALVDYDFTADDGGGPRPHRRRRGQARVAWLRRFYFGDGERRGLAPEPTSAHGGLRAARRRASATSTPARSTPSRSATSIVLRVGRYGPYVERAGDDGGPRVACPRTCAPDELTVEKAEELLAEPSGDRELGTDPATGRADRRQGGRYGPYVTEVLPERRAEDRRKPRTGVAVQVDGAGHGHARRRAAAAVAAARGRRRPGAARRSPRRTAATART